MCAAGREEGAGCAEQAAAAQLLGSIRPLGEGQWAAGGRSSEAEALGRACSCPACTGAVLESESWLCLPCPVLLVDWLVARGFPWIPSAGVLWCYLEILHLNDSKSCILISGIDVCKNRSWVLAS